MSSERLAQDDLLQRIHCFVVASESNELTDDQWTDFDRLLCESDEACRLYAEYMDVSFFAPSIVEAMPAGDNSSPGLPRRGQQAAPCLPPDFLDTRWHGTLGNYFSGWPVAYLVATVVLGLGILIGSVVHVSQPTHVAHQPTPGPSLLSPRPSSSPFVGRITGMVDCRWSDPQTEAFNGASVPLGRKYALSSGLMEITYDSGAKVILQGPCTYEIESPAGGFLSVGKLTARVEKGPRTKDQGPISAIQYPTSNIAESSTLRLPPSALLSPLPSPLFTIKTPTATVTDLGTEFGVDVSQEGVTTSQVFRGAVTVEVASGGGKPEGPAQVLHENEAVRVEKGDAECKIASIPHFRSSHFVRAMPKPQKSKLFDLVDVVAGGDGFSGNRGRGIDPTTGRPCDGPPSNNNYILQGNSEYHQVENMPFVDGVFVPDLRNGSVQVDSSGHVFATPSQSSPHLTSGYVWAGGPISIPPCIQTEDYSAYVKSLRHLPVVLNGVDYSSSGHGVLCLHPNKAITFDLDAVRNANPDWTIARLLAVAANVDVAPELAGLADIRVLVDGQMRFQRRESPRSNSAFSINVPLSETDRFLTLMATDGDDSIYWDWVVFGDPRLELRPNKK